jgi:hypothetical protein
MARRASTPRVDHLAGRDRRDAVRVRRSAPKSDAREGQFPNTSDAPIINIHAMPGAVDKWILKTSIARYGGSCLAYCGAAIPADRSRDSRT